MLYTCLASRVCTRYQLLTKIVLVIYEPCRDIGTVLSNELFRLLRFVAFFMQKRKNIGKRRRQMNSTLSLIVIRS